MTTSDEAEPVPLDLKVVVWGPEQSGKSTLIAQLCPGPGGLRAPTQPSDQPLHEVFWDAVRLRLGASIAGRTVTLRLYSVPGHPDPCLHDKRARALDGVDAIVFVADSARERMAANQASMRELGEALYARGIDAKNVARVVVLNKRDLPNAAPVDVLEQTVNPDGWASLACVASSGDGVRAVLKAIVTSGFPLVVAREQEVADNAVCDLELPPGWIAGGVQHGIVTYQVREPEAVPPRLREYAGALQCSLLPSKGQAPRTILEHFADVKRWGLAGGIEEGLCAYGCYAAARVVSEPFADFRVWCLGGDFVDPLLATWVSADGAEVAARDVEGMVHRVRPPGWATACLRQLMDALRARVSGGGLLLEGVHFVDQTGCHPHALPDLSAGAVKRSLDLLRQHVHAASPDAVAIVVHPSSHPQHVLIVLETPDERLVGWSEVVRHEGGATLAEGIVLSDGTLSELREFYGVTN